MSTTQTTSNTIYVIAEEKSSSGWLLLRWCCLQQKRTAASSHQLLFWRSGCSGVHAASVCQLLFHPSAGPSGPCCCRAAPTATTATSACLRQQPGRNKTGKPSRHPQCAVHHAPRRARDCAGGGSRGAPSSCLRETRRWRK